MMLHERRSEIVEKIRVQRTVKVTDLMEEYGVSIETIRRDLEYLEKKGHLKRVYGGAVMHGLYGEEPSYEHREIINYEYKQAIGRHTARLINDGDTLFIDVGTTTLEVARCLRDKKNLTIITNATLIAQAVIDIPGFRVILLGGMLRPGELSVSGFLADQSLRNFYANRAIIGVGGITAETGITDYDFQEASTRRLMIQRADQVIAVADYSKFGVTAMNSICPITEIDLLVTDWSTPQKTVSQYSGHDIEVHLADRI